MHLSTEAFVAMQNLKLLKMNKVHAGGSFEGLFQDLRWLSWHQFPLKCLPFFYPEKLVYLDLQHNNISTISMKPLVNLKILDLSYSSFRTTPDFSQLPVLEKLLLRFCPNLLKIHPSIGLLAKLIHLDLGFCEKLRNLPTSTCKLKMLNHVDVDFCSSLDHLPKQLANMEGLKKLSAGGTVIKHLPDSIGNLNKLTSLSLQQCNRKIDNPSCCPFSLFQREPPCPETTRFLPPSVSRLCSLRSLDLSDCNLSEVDFPDYLDGLVSLKFLHLERNNLCSLPSSLSQLSNLESLWLDGCTSLQSILRCLGNLWNLYSSDCTSLGKLPDLTNLKHLERMELVNCCNLVELQGFENLNSVLHVNLEGCIKLSTTFEKTMFQGYSDRKRNCKFYFSRQKMPHWFEFEGGSSITFDVPSDVEPDSFATDSLG